ncbi:unnamed protein product [Amaranthus hypochondriacus]
MNEGKYREYGGGCCFHPKEMVVGVCHLCLNERLLIISAKNGSVKSNYSKRFNNSYNNNKPKSPYLILPKIFSIASFFNTRDNHRHLHRHRRRRGSHHDLFDDAVTTSSTSLEDESFISIKFGDNGVASWDKTSNTMSKVSLQNCSLSWGGQTSVKDATIKGSACNYTNKSVVEHAKPKAAKSLRWRNRIGHLLQVIKWKKSTKPNAGRVENDTLPPSTTSKVVEGVKVVRNTFSVPIKTHYMT